MVNEKQFRATFDDTKSKQKKFRHKLDELIHENRALSDSERDLMFDLYADANLGLGTSEAVLWLSNAKSIVVPNFEKFVRDLFYWDKPIVNGNFFQQTLGKYQNYEVPIAELWKQIRSKTHGIGAEALSQSIRMSKEQTRFGPAKPAEV